MSRCRLCLTNDAKNNIFQEGEPNLANRIRICCRLRVQKNDGLPDKICLQCFILLEKLSYFIKVCKKSDSILRNDSESIATKDLQNITIKEENITDDTIEDSFRESYSNPSEDNSKLSKNVEIQKSINLGSVSSNSLKKEKSDLYEDNYTFLNENIDELKKEKTPSTEGGVICPVCEKEFKNKRRLRAHLKTHNAIKKFACPTCGREFVDKHRCKAHELTHSNIKKFSCEVCGKKFLTRYYSVRHMKKIHMKRELVHCNLCNKSYKCDYIKAHMKGHLAQAEFVCDICNNKYSSKTAIITHMRIHTGEKPFACKYCPSRFSRSESRVDHERLHTGETPFKCPICGKGFAQKPNMKSHFKYNHKDLDPQLFFQTKSRGSLQQTLPSIHTH